MEGSEKEDLLHILSYSKCNLGPQFWPETNPELDLTLSCNWIIFICALHLCFVHMLAPIQEYSVPGLDENEWKKVTIIFFKLL